MSKPVEQREGQPGKRESFTSLNLFHQDLVDRRGAASQFRDVMAFRQGFEAIGRAYTSYSTAVNQQHERREALKGALEKEVPRIVSRFTVNNAYLQTEAEIMRNGGSTQDAFRFFDGALAINIRLNPKIVNALTSAHRNVRQLSAAMQSPEARERGVTARYNEIVNEEIPQWFGSKDKVSWASFVANNAAFVRYKVFENAHVPLGPVSREAFPAWYTGSDQVPPDHETVLDAFRQDVGQFGTFALVHRDSEQQKKDAYSQGTELFNTAAVEVEEARRQASPRGTSFIDTLQFLYMTGDDVWEYAVEDLQRLRASTGKDRDRMRRSPKDSRDSIIRAFGDSEHVFDSIPTALYLEKKLLDGGVIDDVQDTHINNTHVLNFKLLFEGIEQTEESFEVIKELFPEQHALFIGTLVSMVSLLDNDERSILSESIASHMGEPFEVFLRDLSVFVSAGLQRYNAGETQEQTNIRKEMRSFAVDWISQNWQEAGKAMAGELAGELGDESAGAANLLYRSHVFEQAAEEIAGGNTHDWQVYTSKEPTGDRRKMRNLTGTTLADRADALAALMPEGEREITENIVVLLDFIAGLPVAVEPTSKSSRLKDRFHTIELGGATIQYEANPLKKELVFVVEPKSA